MLVRQRQLLERSYRRIAFRHSFTANLPRQPFYLLGRYLDAGKLLERLFSLHKRPMRGSGVDDFALQAGTIATAINAQTLALREKNPADISGRGFWVRPRPHHRLRLLTDAARAD